MGRTRRSGHAGLAVAALCALGGSRCATDDGGAANASPAVSGAPSEQGEPSAPVGPENPGASSPQGAASAPPAQGGARNEPSMGAGGQSEEVANPSPSPTLPGSPTSPAGGGAAPSGGGSGGAPSMTTGGAGPSAVGGGGGAAAPSGGAGGVAGPSDEVTLTESSFTFEHFPIEANDQFVWSGPTVAAGPTTRTTYDTFVLENGYLRVTLLPSYGGRVLSIVHKPTNRELLYQNPVGTPYLMGEDIFYYNYLVIMGGIFPSFPEPEHGKYWNQPYDYEIVSETPDAVTVRMSRQDDLDPAVGVPERYIVGRTDVLVQVEVTLRAGRSNLELHTQLTNTRSEVVPELEYWTVTTLAPGSTPGDTAIPLDTRILANMERVHLLESSWSWFGQAEQRVADEVFVWNNLSYFTNWVDQGTAFANPRYESNWSGLVNYVEHMGILRVSANVETPGLKLWTFGKQSLDVDLADGEQWLRPTIEMWHGVTPEFWTRRALAANEVRQWDDDYFAILGLDEVTAASEHGAVYLSASSSGADGVLDATATLNVPGQTVHAILRLGGEVVSEQDVVVEAAEPTRVSATIPAETLTPGAVFAAEFVQGEVSLLSAQTTVE